ncbi:hypothetical protein AB0B94_30615 [Micromonospora sp. NPDC048986]|uniref:hypothetical protein n=1 Tax=Micromonospora sp. NPDC048986 TaxID=3155644 RepID=UPI0033CC7795
MLDDAKRAAAPKCTKRRADGQHCKANAIRGTDSCRRHAGKSLAVVRAQVAVRDEVLRWGLGDATVDPGELLLRLVTQAAIRADAYAADLSRIVAETDGDLRKALTGDSYTVTAEGDPVKTGEYVRAITKLEADERDRAANFAAKAVAAGLAERQVRLAERQGELIFSVIRAILDDLNLSPEQQAVASEAASRHLRSVS